MTEKETPPQDRVSSSSISHTNVYDEQEQPSGYNYRGGIIALGGCLVLVVVILAVCVVLGVTSVDRIVSGIGGMFGAASPARATVLSSQTIVESILPLGQLVTVSAQFAKVNVNVSVNQGVLNMCSYNVNHAVQGTIEAGVDVTKISEDALHYDAASETYTLTLPATQLTSCRIDYIQQYDWSVNACNPDWDGTRLLANYQTLTKFRDDAVEGGILKRAELEARLVLGGLVRLLTGHPVVITYEQTAAPMPSSCAPEAPQGWTYDSTGNFWSR